MTCALSYAHCTIRSQVYIDIYRYVGRYSSLRRQTLFYNNNGRRTFRCPTRYCCVFLSGIRRLLQFHAKSADRAGKTSMSATSYTVLVAINSLDKVVHCVCVLCACIVIRAIWQRICRFAVKLTENFFQVARTRRVMGLRVIGVGGG